MANFEMKTDLKNLDRLIEEIKKAKRLKVKVGIDDTEHYDNGTKVSDVATYLEYGWTQNTTSAQRGYIFYKTGLHVGTTLNLPARPIFGYTSKTCRAKWLKVGANTLKSKAFAENPYQVAFLTMQKLGIMAVQDIKNTIMTNGHGTFAPRSPLTVLMYTKEYDKHKPKGDPEKLKKRNVSAVNSSTDTKALMYSKHLLNSIDFEITEDDK